MITDVERAVAIPVYGNGDVRDRDDAQRMVAATGCAGVMIGRAALGAPWVFSADPVDRDARTRIIRRHVELILAHLPERTALVQLKKHLAWYSTGRPGSAQARPAIFQATDAGRVQEIFWAVW